MGSGFLPSGNGMVKPNEFSGSAFQPVTPNGELGQFRQAAPTKPSEPVAGSTPSGATNSGAGNSGQQGMSNPSAGANAPSTPAGPFAPRGPFPPSTQPTASDSNAMRGNSFEQRTPNAGSSGTGGSGSTGFGGSSNNSSRPNDGVIFTRDRAFQIPFSVDDTELSRLTEVQLHVSRDRGISWTLAKKGQPKDKSFPFIAREDGEYYFAVRTVDREQRMFPAAMEQATPGLRVMVDTTPPQVSLREAAGSGEEIGLDGMWSTPISTLSRCGLSFALPTRSIGIRLRSSDAVAVERHFAQVSVDRW